MSDPADDRFSPGPRRPSGGARGSWPHDAENFLREAELLRRRFERARAEGYEGFAATESDSYDVGSLAVVRLADLVARLQEARAEGAPDALAGVPEVDLRGLAASRNFAAHHYLRVDRGVFWRTVTIDAPRVLARIRQNLIALRP